MKNHIILAVAVGALGACGEARESQTEANSSSTNQQSATAQTYSGTGTATAVAGDQVTINHGPIAEIGWPAMTMTFTAASTDMTSGVSVGDHVSFDFKQDGGAYALTSLSKDR